MAEWQFPVEAGHIMLFARAIGDPNPRYAGDEEARAAGAQGVVAPPTFIQASAQFNPDYPLRPKIGQPWLGSGKEPTGIERRGGGGGGGVGLHAEQHYEYHRPLRPGDVLSPTNLEGRTWEREGRSGHLRFSESVTEWRDQEGHLVITARSVGVLTGGPRSSSEERS